MPENWPEAKDAIFKNLVPGDMEIGDETIYQKITDCFGFIYAYHGNGAIFFISKSDLDNWKISGEELEKQANHNAAKLWGETEVNFKMW